MKFYIIVVLCVLSATPVPYFGTRNAYPQERLADPLAGIDKQELRWQGNSVYACNLMEAGRLNNASLEFIKIATHCPDSDMAADAWFYLGRIELDTGRDDLAVFHFNRALNENPSDEMYARVINALLPDIEETAAHSSKKDFLASFSRLAVELTKDNPDDPALLRNLEEYRSRIVEAYDRKEPLWVALGPYQGIINSDPDSREAEDAYYNIVMNLLGSVETTELQGLPDRHEGSGLYLMLKTKYGSDELRNYTEFLENTLKAFHRHFPESEKLYHAMIQAALFFDDAAKINCTISDIAPWRRKEYLDNIIKSTPAGSFYHNLARDLLESF